MPLILRGGGGNTLIQETNKLNTFNYQQDINNTKTTSQTTSLQNQAINTKLPYIQKHLLDYTINPKAFINAHDFDNFADLIDEVKRIDSDKKAYEEMIHEPVFLGDFDPYSFYEQKILDFFTHIIEQGPIDSKRRGEGIFLNQYTDTCATFNKFTPDFINYCYKRQKMIRKIRYFSEYPRNFLRKLRGK